MCYMSCPSQSSQSKIISIYRGQSVIWISRSLIWSKTLMELMFNPCGEVKRAQLAKSTLLPSTLMPLEFSRSFKVCSDAKERERGTKSSRKLLHLFIPSKTTTLVPEFAVEDLRLGRTAALVPEFSMKDLSLGRILMMTLENSKIDSIIEGSSL